MPETGSFSERLKRLREIVDRLENGAELEESVALYKEACACAAECRKKLEEARVVLETEGGNTEDAEAFLSRSASGSAV